MFSDSESLYIVQKIVVFWNQITNGTQVIGNLL
mgnify:FL=1